MPSLVDAVRIRHGRRVSRTLRRLVNTTSTSHCCGIRLPQTTNFSLRYLNSRAYDHVVHTSRAESQRSTSRSSDNPTRDNLISLAKSYYGIGRIYSLKLSAPGPRQFIGPTDDKDTILSLPSGTDLHVKLIIAYHQPYDLHVFHNRFDCCNALHVCRI